MVSTLQKYEYLPTLFYISNYLVYKQYQAYNKLERLVKHHGPLLYCVSAEDTLAGSILHKTPCISLA